MKTPETGSAWHRHCPEAWPAEYDVGAGAALPPGFRRYATDREAALIVGRITEAEFTGQSAQSDAHQTKPDTPRRGPMPVVRKLTG